MATVPGTVGGAVHGNAGAFGSETADALVDAELVDMNGDTWTAKVDELAYSYRTSSLQGTPIVCVRARFRGTVGDRANAVRRIKEMANERIKKQPLAQPNTGSIFRNPPGDFAGRLIEAAGLKGRVVGGAMVSEKHANFIVNTNGATANDVRALMTLVQQEVAQRLDVKLVPEVELVGEW
jgi:UDP-N-acetylmuramate dehydrogenase